MQSNKPSNLSELTGEIKGWQDAINSVRASLQQYPNAGGDITIMAEVERILAAKDAEWRHLMANIYSIATGKTLDNEDAALGMATSAVHQLRRERVSFRDQFIWIRRHATAQLAEMKAERDSLREALKLCQSHRNEMADYVKSIEAKDGKEPCYHCNLGDRPVNGLHANHNMDGEFVSYDKCAALKAGKETKL